MSIFLATILAISATPSGTTQENVAPAASATPAVASTAAAVAPATTAARSGRELSDAAHAALRHWAKATDPEADAAARELLGIYREILQDTGMARAQRESLRLTVRGRLDQLCTQIGKRVAKEKAAAKPDNAVKSVAMDKDKTILAGMGVPAAGGAAAGAGGAAAGQNANADGGQQLVDLIQTVICPKSWDINGGPCTIYYWQQQHAIVVRGTGDVHEAISDTLEQLNRASR